MTLHFVKVVKVGCENIHFFKGDQNRNVLKNGRKECI